jgi:uncharacterized repeat protein (TIGR03806 family)
VALTSPAPQRAALGAVLALAAGCGGNTAVVDDGNFLATLSPYGFFVGPLADQRPAASVIPYDVNAPLYSDGASKLRFVSLPPGGRIQYDDTERWTFPEGSTLIKTFYYPHDGRDPGQGRRLLETRLLALSGGVWTSATYLWNDAQTEASHHLGGQAIAVDYIDESGTPQSLTFQEPNSSQCKECHLKDKQIWPIGPRTEQWNRLFDYGQGPENQLTHLDKAGLLDESTVGGTLPATASLPAMPDPRGGEPLDRRARSWLDANCAHCHNQGGYAAATALRLEMETTALVDLGVCRHPTACPSGCPGEFDVVPGDPQHSILYQRIKSLDAKVKMPQLPLTTIDQFGVDLVGQWITSLAAPACQ